MTSRREADPTQPLYRFWQPRYWPLWLGLVFLRCATWLPVRGQLALGRALGRVASHAVPGRRRVAAINLALCFPELDEAARAALLRSHFESLGMTLMEHGMAWWYSDARVRSCVEVRGAEHLRAALGTGRGVVLVTGHFGAQEFTGRLLRDICPVGALYRPSKNPFVDEVLKRIRSRSASLLIPKQGMRRMIRTVRQGMPVWYAPDQSQRRSFSALLPFLGEPAMTATALSEIARLGNALVVPVLPRRFPASGRYTLDILPAVADFPGPSPEADTLRVNAILEAHIRQAPEQYYWIHRRFKGRPPPLPDPYETAP